jgi:small-conductance mechanosensitive channel
MTAVSPIERRWFLFQHIAKTLMGEATMAERFSPKQKSHPSTVMHVRTKIALIAASVAVGLLTTTFGMFHVNVFLESYGLSRDVFSVGMVFFAVINAANDVLGAWFLDTIVAARYQRSDLVGMAGILFALCFLVPFFRPWTTPFNSLADGTHFVIAMSLYDTLYSLTMILYGSIVSDDSLMSQSSRIQLLVYTKVSNLLASFLVVRIGLYVFDAHYLYPFRIFVLLLVVLVCGVSIAAQTLISGGGGGGGGTPNHHRWIPNQHEVLAEEESLSDVELENKSTSPPIIKQLNWRQVVRDFREHRNFWCWIGMEVLLESQNSFNMNFRKTFVDQLLIEGGKMDKEICDWWLSFSRPATTILSLALFVPIRQYGYTHIYHGLFLFNFCFSGLMLMCGYSAIEHHVNLVTAFVFIYPVVTSAVLSAGFALAMADMVLDMKVGLVRQRRNNVPSMAALFMGANALFCKPAESVLPIIAARSFTDGDDHSALFNVMVWPPFVFSIFQWLFFRNYSLSKCRVLELQNELKGFSDDGAD